MLYTIVVTGGNVKDNVDIILRRNSSGSSEVHVDHEVQEVIDPHSDDLRLAAMTLTGWSTVCTGSLISALRL